MKLNRTRFAILSITAAVFAALLLAALGASSAGASPLFLDTPTPNGGNGYYVTDWIEFSYVYNGGGATWGVPPKVQGASWSTGTSYTVPADNYVVGYVGEVLSENVSTGDIDARNVFPTTYIDVVGGSTTDSPRCFYVGSAADVPGYGTYDQDLCDWFAPSVTELQWAGSAGYKTPGATISYGGWRQNHLVSEQGTLTTWRVRYILYGPMPTATPTATATQTFTPTATATNTPAPTSTPITSVGVWHIGNYVEDDSFEGINWFEDIFEPRWSTMGYVTRGTASGALCGNNYSRMYTSTSIGGIETYTSQPFGIWQDILWWEDDMYISFAYRTTGTASVSAYLVDPFNQKISIASGLTNATSGWAVYYGTVPDQILGKYTLAFEGSNLNPSDYVDLDAIAVSEKTYVHCEYQSIPINPPPSALPQFSFTGNVEESAAINEPQWVAASNNALVTGSGASQVLAIVAPVADDALDAIWASSIDDAFAKSGNWIDVLEMELIYPPGENLPGYTDNQVWYQGRQYKIIQNTVEHSLAVSYVISDFSDNIMALENIETGEIIDVNAVYVGDDANGWHRYGSTVYVPTGRYRLRVGFAGTFTETVYISKVCLGGAEFIISTGACEGLPGWHLFSDDATLDAMAAQLTAVAGSTGTASANVNSTAAAAWAATATPRAAVTQTALAASGNATSVYRATQTQAWALTATPRYAATSTAWVSQFRATLTAQAGATATRRVILATANAQGSINATNQAASLATAYAQATNSAQLTAVVWYQATLHANSTAHVENQPTVNGYATGAAATLAAAQTQLAAEANATTIANATNAAALVAQINAQATAYANAQGTLIGQMTQVGYSNGTLIAQATAVAQAQQTLIATLQIAGTQQVLQLPPSQPMPEDMDPNVGCSRPDNPLNLAWWIDYEVCRVLWYFTWNEANTVQVLTIATQVTSYEPFGTVGEIQGLLTDINAEANSYDWDDTGASGSADALPEIVTDPDAAASADGIITFIPLATEVPLFNADFDFDNQTLLYVLSADCELKLEANLGPYLTPPICFLISVTRSTGYLPFVRLLFDLGAIFLLVRYYWGWFLELAGERERAALREPTPGELQTMPANARKRP